MKPDKPSPLQREIIEKWIETLDAHKLPDWIEDHVTRYKTDPHLGHMWDASAYGGFANTPTLLLTTTGRKSGRPHTLPLLYGRDGERYIVVGTKGGAPRHPAWYLNLQADPEITVQVADHIFKARASTATGAERERLLKILIDIYPPIESYQQPTERVIPVVVLEPLP